MSYRTPAERLKATCKGLKQAQYQNRMAILYATGKLSGKQYRKYTQGTGLPKSVIGIRTHQALGLMSKKQADYLVGNHRYPKPIPTQHKTKRPKKITKIIIAPPQRSKHQPQPKTRPLERQR